jgi:hypothetical protein
MKHARFACSGGEIDHDIQATLFQSRRAFLRYCRSKNLVIANAENDQPISGAGCAAKMFGFGREAVQDGEPHAELVFYVDQFTDDSIAHEVFHGLVHLFKAVGRDPMGSTHDEELFAMLQGKLTQAITDWRKEVCA